MLSGPAEVFDLSNFMALTISNLEIFIVSINVLLLIFKSYGCKEELVYTELKWDANKFAVSISLQLVVLYTNLNLSFVILNIIFRESIDFDELIFQ